MYRNNQVIGNEIYCNRERVATIDETALLSNREDFIDHVENAGRHPLWCDDCSDLEREKDNLILNNENKAHKILDLENEIKRLEKHPSPLIYNLLTKLCYFKPHRGIRK